MTAAHRADPARPSRARRTAVTVAVTAALAGTGTATASFTAATESAGNSISTGTVVLGDDDGGTAALYTPPLDGNTRPGQEVVKCITVTYTGTLPATVGLHAEPVTAGGLFDLTVDVGTGGGPFPSCATFVQASTIFTGTLADVPTDPALALETGPPGGLWATGEARSFRFTLTTRDDTTENGRTYPLATSTHAFTWRAESA